MTQYQPYTDYYQEASAIIYLILLLVGLIIMNYPGKFELERWIILRPHVLPAINWLRTKYNHPPLLAPPGKREKAEKMSSNKGHSNLLWSIFSLYHLSVRQHLRQQLTYSLPVIRWLLPGRISGLLSGKQRDRC